MTTQGALHDLLDIIGGEERIAVDTEFHRERTYFPKVALIQIAWSGGLALIDPLEIDLTPMAALLESETLWVMHAAGQDIEVFQRACGTAPHRLFDTQLAAGFIGMSSPSLSALHQQELGFRLAKGDRLTDWLARPLTESQLSYAASDVAHLLEIHDRLMLNLRDRGRLEWAIAECEEMLEREITRREPEDAWRKIKEARNLGGKAKMVVRSVASWRERRAADIDIPVRHVLPDLAVVAIAQKAPTTTEDLRKVRGVDGRHLKGDVARGILEAVASASELQPLPAGDERPPGREREARAAVTLVSAWVSQLARDLEIDPVLVGTRSDIEALVRGGGDSRMSHGWRHDLVGEPVDELLSGRAALAFDGQGELELVPRTT
ncbi:MAG: HRDC domain-containing protein [Actinobacteria bacterium]|nr:HRDC domain-containing protein [Actinomycetota bacterium]